MASIKEKIDFYIKNRPNSGFYYTDDGRIGDVNVPGSPYRYMDIPTFYRLWGVGVERVWEIEHANELIPRLKRLLKKIKHILWK